MKKYIVAGCIAACLTNSLMANAQSKEIIFGSSSRDIHGKSGKHKAEDGKNAITTGMFSWLNGYQPVYYERALTTFLSLRIGAGVTFRSFGNDLGQLAYEDGKAKDDILISDSKGAALTLTNDITDDYATYTYRKSKIGTYLSVAPRLYFGDNVLNGFTLFPMLEYKTFKYGAQQADAKVITTNSKTVYNGYDDQKSVPRTGAWIDENMKCIDFTMNIGGNFQASSQVDFAWHFGFGVRNFKAHRQDLASYNTLITKQYLDQTIDYSRIRPFFTADFCVGGWF